MKQFIVLLLSLSCIKGMVLAINAKEHPNIIFILADDLGWKDVGFMGNKKLIN